MAEWHVRGPPRLGRRAVASRAMVESSTLVIAKVAWPARLALRRAASVSAVSPDWDTTITPVSVKDRPIAVLAGVLHVDGNAAEVFDNRLGEQTCMAAGAACRDDKLVLNTGQPIECGRTGTARNPSPFT